jgi:hypothetical protein
MAAEDHTPQEEQDNKVWIVEINLGYSTVTVWNEGPNATIGTVADQMEKVLDGEAHAITITRGDMPDTAEHFPEHDAKSEK